MQRDACRTSLQLHGAEPFVARAGVLLVYLFLGRPVPLSEQECATIHGFLARRLDFVQNQRPVGRRHRWLPIYDKPAPGQGSLRRTMRLENL